MATCKECLHIAVCGRYSATGGRVKECEHFFDLVRCKDCEWCIYDKSSDEHYCNHEYGMIGAVRKNYFCSYGERKDNG